MAKITLKEYVNSFLVISVIAVIFLGAYETVFYTLKGDPHDAFLSLGSTLAIVLFAIIGYLILWGLVKLKVIKEKKEELPLTSNKNKIGSSELTENGSKVSKIKINIFGFLNFEQEIKDNEPNDERKLQIKLVKLQTDVQNQLAISLALFAVSGAFVVAVAQKPLTFQGFLFSGIAILFGVFAADSVIKAQSFRKEMDNLT